VPFGYLVAVAIVACPTLFAVVPLWRPKPLAKLSWALSLVLNEMPFVAFYWLLAATLLAAAQGDLDSPGGWASFGLAALTTVGLAVVVWRALRAVPAVERALAEGLGPDWRAAIDPDLAARLRRRLPYGRILLRPFLVRRGDVERIADISYGDAGVHNLLDVYRHRSRPSGGPVLVYLHGGGFTSGRKNREGRPLVYRLASQGWVCVSANYRLRPAATFPDYLVDVKKVIVWVREHGHEYGAEPGVLFVAGSSAGAHLAALTALTANDPDFQPGFESADTSVTGGVGLYGYYGTVYSDGPASSPAAHVRADAPPFFAVHGDQDTYVGVKGARRFVAKLRAASANPVVYAELPGAQHTFDVFHSIRFETVVDAVEAFAAWVRSGAAAQQAGQPGGYETAERRAEQARADG
jgi:acetyl esterase/lipase